MPYVAITGGSFSGKTTLIERLGSLGHRTVPEAAIEVIAELVDEHGLDGQAAWRDANPDEFQCRISVRQRAHELACEPAGNEIVFCDRGTADGIAYHRVATLNVPDDVWRVARESRYAAVFVLDTLPSFDLRADTGRVHNLQHSRRVAGTLVDVYRELGYEPVTLPADDVDARLRRIRDHLGIAP